MRRLARSALHVSLEARLRQHLENVERRRIDREPAGSVAISSRRRAGRDQVRRDDARPRHDRRRVEQEQRQPRAVELRDLVGHETEPPAKTRIRPPASREVLGELPEESGKFAPDDLVVMALPGFLDKRRPVVGDQERAAGHGVRRRKIVAEGEADECRRKIVAGDQRLQAGAPARLHVGRRGAEPFRRRPHAGRRQTGRARASSASAVRMVAAPKEPPDTPEMAKMRRAGAIALLVGVRQFVRPVEKIADCGRSCEGGTARAAFRGHDDGGRATARDRNWPLSTSRQHQRCRFAVCRDPPRRSAKCERR